MPGWLRSCLTVATSSQETSRRYLTSPDLDLGDNTALTYRLAVNTNWNDAWDTLSRVSGTWLVLINISWHCVLISLVFLSFAFKEICLLNSVFPRVIWPQRPPFKKYLCEGKHSGKQWCRWKSKVQIWLCQQPPYFLPCFSYNPSLHTLLWFFVTFHFYIISNLQKSCKISTKTSHILTLIPQLIIYVSAHLPTLPSIHPSSSEPLESKFPTYP